MVHPATAEGGAVPVLLGLGANLGEPREQLRRALERLGAVVEVAAVSSLYRTEPVGLREQPDFLNLVCAGVTSLGARELLDVAREVERALGRVRGARFGPRTLDVDLLDYGGHVSDAPELTLPHPRLHERGFVLVPLDEVAPAWRHPVSGLTPREMIARAGRLERVERLGPLGGGW